MQIQAKDSPRLIRCRNIPSRQATDEELLLYHTKEFIQVIEESRGQTMEESEMVCSKYDRFPHLFCI